MKSGCLGVFIIVIGLAFLINFPLFTIGIALTIWGIYELRVNKRLKAKSKLIPLIITSGVLLSFGGCAAMISDTGNENIAEQETQESLNKEEKPENEKLFVPEVKVASEIIENELVITGETNLPEKTLLIATLTSYKDEEIKKEIFVDSEKFKSDPIPINELKTGDQTIHLSLAADQFSSVVNIIGENGELLDGDLVNEDKELIVSLNVDIPKESVTADANEKEKNEEKSEEKTENNSKATHTSGTTDKIPVTLVRTIDGDTIKVIYDGQEHNVRYLLIDTPETSHPRLGKQPFGEEAKEKNRELVNSGDLYLEFDVGERFDKYSRLLAYVYVGNTLVQEELLKEGLARVAYVYPPNTRHLDRFQNAQQTAKDAKIGIWSIENYVSDSGFNSSDSNSSQSNSSNSGSTSNNQSSNNQSNSPGNSSSNSNNSSNKSTGGGSVYYKNCTEARNAGVTPLYRGDPGYSSHLDRDGDGIACE